jgi:hypothetical protein
MSATDSAADDSTELPTDDVHGKLAARFDELETALEQADDSYYMEVEQTSEMYGTWSVTIDSDDWILNEGEIGDMRFHVILGPQGGLRLADSRRDLGSERDYLAKNDTKGDAWSELKRAIKRAR